MEKEKALKLVPGTKCIVELESKKPYSGHPKYRMIGEYLYNDLSEMYNEDAYQAELAIKGLTIEDVVSYSFRFQGKYGEFESNVSADQIIDVVQ